MLSSSPELVPSSAANHLHAIRAERALAQFSEIAGAEATHLVFAPGRVNLIGEHTDYSGGFGGCCVALVQTERAEEIATKIRERYQTATGIEPTIFATRPGDGPSVLLKPWRLSDLENEGPLASVIRQKNSRRGRIFIHKRLQTPKSDSLPEIVPAPRRHPEGLFLG